ncbi:MAG: hypothetical protein LBD51_06135 [Bifidobacteriaceae bacterium]|jgi:hypothetical protein|nr:hypothetical protein [Bifidobacteriaceae bacterium]
MQATTNMIRRAALALAALVALPGLALALALPTSAAPGCSLQAMIDSGGLVAVPAGCVEDGEIVVRGSVELGGGPFTVGDRITVKAGGELKFADASQSTADVFVEPGASFQAVGSDIAFGGQLWVQAAGSAQIEGLGGQGVVVDRLINQGFTKVAGLVRLGREDQGVYTWLAGENHLALGQLAPESVLWFYQPASPQAVALVLGGTVGADLASVILCDNGGCEASTTAGVGDATWLVLSPGGAGQTTPRPTPSASPSPSQPPAEPADLQELVANAPSGATLQIPAGTVLESTVTVATSDGEPTQLTLTGGPIARAHGGTLLEVPAGSSLTLRDIVIDGQGDFAGAVEWDAAAVEVARGAALALQTGAQIKDNPSYGIVNAGQLWLSGTRSGVTGSALAVPSGAAGAAPAGGAGVWNKSGAVFYMGGGRIADNTVSAPQGQTAYGGGVLNAGTMFVYGGAISGNAVDGDGGGIAVVREPGGVSGSGGRLDFGSYAGQTAALAGEPELTANIARRGGGVAVADQAAWGGSPSPAPEAEVPDSVPSAILDKGRISGNAATGGGRGVVAYGGAALELAGPLVIEAPARAAAVGSLGVAVYDAYFFVSGDVLVADGSGIGLMAKGWPVYLKDGFTGQGRLLIEHVLGLEAGKTLSPIKWRGGEAKVSPQALEAIEFALPGLTVSMFVEPGGEILVSAAGAEIGAEPEPSTGEPKTPAPSSPAPAASAAPSQAPQAPAETAPASQAATGADGQEASRAGGQTDWLEADPAATAGGAASPSGQAASPTPSPSASATKGASPSQDEAVVSSPEPPAGASMRGLGFTLMAVGVFGLSLLGIYVMRRGGFFAA